MYLQKSQALLYSFFACSLDNDVACENQENDDKRIVDPSYVED